MKVTREFVDAFNLVHATFRTSPTEIDEAKVAARADMAVAQVAYFSTAAMIRAGWKPLEEQASVWIARTGFVDPALERGAA